VREVTDAGWPHTDAKRGGPPMRAERSLFDAGGYAPLTLALS